MSHRVPVFYVPQQSVAGAASFSPSAGKPGLVLRDWQEHGLDIEVFAFNPATRDAMYMAHAPEYVQGVLDLKIDNGFGNRSPAIAAGLPHSVGSVVAASKHVLRNGGVACSPTSGFHHAHYTYGSGFCTFNGLMVAAVQVLTLGLAQRVVILDMDYHYGDGTQDIIDRLGLDKQVESLSYGGRRLWRHEHLTQEHLCAMLLKAGCGPSTDSQTLLLYQAGADSHIDDPLGGFLTTEQMIERDTRVFTFARDCRVPIVWNLAGGYQQEPDGSIPKVLELHRNTMEACVSVFGDWR